MKALLIAAVAAALIIAVVAKNPQFEAFKRSHNRMYASPEEEAFRQTVFEQNMKKAVELQKRNPLATFGANRFADMTEEEFKSYHNGEAYFKSRSQPNGILADATAAPKSIDWRKKGAVTPIKNQAQCGGCWAFSTTGNIEGQWFLAGNKLTSLSEQELISCDTTDKGCNGGIMNNAFQWLIDNTNGVISTEAAYPFASQTGKAPACNMNKVQFGAQIYNYTALAQDEPTMASYMYQNGPISIAVDATSWQTYTGGIMTDCQSNQLDHGVLIVGLNTQGSTPYWIVKNQWSTSWGEEGYIYLQYGTNQCLLNQDPCTSLVNSSGPVPPPPAPTGSGSGSTDTPAPWTSAPSGSGSGVTPAPSAAYFQQIVCTDQYCSESCQLNQLPQNECLQAGSDQSAIAVCGETDITLTIYSNGECSGNGQSQEYELDTCLQFADGQGSETFQCPDNKAKNVKVSHPRKLLRRRLH